jgi:TonB family protein
MNSASFLFLSVGLHAAVLVYPASFGGQHHGGAIRVTLLPGQPERVGGGGAAGSGSLAPKVAYKSKPGRPPAVAPRVTPKPAASSEPQAGTAAEAEMVLDSGIALTTTNVASMKSGDSTNFDYAIDDTPGTDEGTGETGTGGYGAYGAGVGSGGASGAGMGAGSSGPGAVLIHARYRDTPKPNYPESARRDGREGRVLLRVLVDHQGRSKRVEINSSSGDDALDHAAAEAIKRWRFHPARHGEMPVASWLRVPVEFRLEDANH